MNFEVLKRSHGKRNIMIGVFVVAIISACILTFTRARYRITQSVQIATGQINYSGYDFKIIAMYQENDSGSYDEIEQMPSSGYVINEEESYCTIDGTNKDPEAKLYTDSQGQHVIAGLKKNSKCYLYFDRKLCSDEFAACNIILARRTPQVRSLPITTSTKVEGTNGKGNIYQAQDDDGTTYYFAGNPDDNWILFAGYYWRIIRINGDGTVRIIYSGTDSSVTTGDSLRIETAAFNINSDASYYVGLKYSSSQHGTTTDSTILQRLNTWYTSNISSTNRDKIDTNAGFCGDREMASGYSWSVTSSKRVYYAAYERLIRNANNVEPTFKCKNSSDLYTVSDSNHGNKALQHPIGLITADEVIYAGMAWNGGTTNNYLYTNNSYWTMSPYYFSGFRAYVFHVARSGVLYGDSGVYSSALGVRPVINLRADVELTGTGTSTDPYQVIIS